MEITLAKTQTLSLKPETKLICSRIDAFVRLLQKHAYDVKGYTPEAIHHFDSLEQSQRESILCEFQKYSRICAEADITGISLRDSKQLTKTVLRKIGMIAPLGFFETLESDDIVEIYSSSGVQIFRNFVFYDHCSYTLLDLISYPWFELLERHESITASIGEHVSTVMGECNEVITSKVKPHYMRELFSEERRMFIARFNHFAPLFFGPGTKGGFICSGKLSPILGEPEKVSFLGLH